MNFVNYRRIIKILKNINHKNTNKITNETLGKANEAAQRIQDFEYSISKIESGEKGCQGPVINFNFMHEPDKEALKKVMINHLKKELAKIKKIFASIK